MRTQFVSLIFLFSVAMYGLFPGAYADPGGVDESRLTAAPCPWENVWRQEDSAEGLVSIQSGAIVIGGAEHPFSGKAQHANFVASLSACEMGPRARYLFKSWRSWWPIGFWYKGALIAELEKDLSERIGKAQKIQKVYRRLHNGCTSEIRATRIEAESQLRVFVVAAENAAETCGKLSRLLNHPVAKYLEPMDGIIQPTSVKERTDQLNRDIRSKAQVYFHAQCEGLSLSLANDDLKNRASQCAKYASGSLKPGVMELEVPDEETAFANEAMAVLSNGAYRDLLEAITNKDLPQAGKTTRQLQLLSALPPSSRVSTKICTAYAAAWQAFFDEKIPSLGGKDHHRFTPVAEFLQQQGFCGAKESEVFLAQIQKWPSIHKMRAERKSFREAFLSIPKVSHRLKELERADYGLAYGQEWILGLVNEWLNADRKLLASPGKYNSYLQKLIKNKKAHEGHWYVKWRKTGERMLDLPTIDKYHTVGPARLPGNKHIMASVLERFYAADFSVRYAEAVRKSGYPSNDEIRYLELLLQRLEHVGKVKGASGKYTASRKRALNGLYSKKRTHFKRLLAQGKFPRSDFNTLCTVVPQLKKGGGKLGDIAVKTTLLFAQMGGIVYGGANLPVTDIANDKISLEQAVRSVYGLRLSDFNSSSSSCGKLWAKQRQQKKQRNWQKQNCTFTCTCMSNGRQATFPGSCPGYGDYGCRDYWEATFKKCR